MSSKVKILLVEDELIIAESLKELLENLGYEVLGIEVNAEEALSEIVKKTPDLAILDIQLKGEKDGIWLADQIKAGPDIPFIFLTSHGDEKTVKEAVTRHPFGYLIKPFDKTDIFTAVECALSVANRNYVKNDDSVFQDFLFVKDDNAFVKIQFDDVLYLKASGNYIEVHSTHKKLLIRSSLKDISPKLPSRIFQQVHRSYIVNLQKISSFSSNFLIINNQEIPLSIGFRDDLMKRFVTH